jgi:Protein of unknown function (DUF4240)
MNDAEFARSIPESFWAVIDAAGQDAARFRELLGPISRSQLIRLLWTYEEVASHLRTEQHARHAAPDLSEDGLAELANWVVAQGAAAYVEVLEHPERIPARHDDAGFVSQLVEEYEERYGGDLPINTHTWDSQWRTNRKASPWA